MYVCICNISLVYPLVRLLIHLISSKDQHYLKFVGVGWLTIVFATWRWLLIGDISPNDRNPIRKKRRPKEKYYSIGDNFFVILPGSFFSRVRKESMGSVGKGSCKYALGTHGCNATREINLLSKHCAWSTHVNSHVCSALFPIRY
jgi:hypothetical protein